MDERGARFIIGDPDDLYRIEPGEWYGWPDYASGIRMDDPAWGEGGRNREPLIQNPPNPNPPRPVAMFEPHLAANGFDFCRDPHFGFEGDAFVAGFGDLAPVTIVAQGARTHGFKVVRVNVSDGSIHDFAVNRIEGPASKLPHAGFERPSHCLFGPDGALYVVDYGEIKIAPEKGGIRMKLGTGSLWRIRRTAEPQGQFPPPPKRVPLYLLQGLAILGGVALLAGLVIAGARLLRRRK
jgi:glucose/arabinose dehydrogenase